jgi:hypothetical protein
MQAKVTVEILEDGKKSGELSTLVDIHADVELIVRDNPVSALFWIFGKAETQLVREAERMDTECEDTDSEGNS